DPERRRIWREETWPAIRAEARRRGALLLFGDEATFAQWGSLSYTWAPRGQQPEVRTCGKRKAQKVFGLIDYCSGRVTAHTRGQGVWSACRQAVKGLRPRAAQVAKTVARSQRMAEPSSLREPPLILRAMTCGRTVRSARLLVGLTPGVRMNSNSSL